MNPRKSRREFLQSSSIVAIASVTGCVGLPWVKSNDEGIPLTIENQRSESYKISVAAIEKSTDEKYMHIFNIGENEKLTRTGFFAEAENGTYRIKVSLDTGQSGFSSDFLEFPADFTGRHLYVHILDSEKRVLNIYVTHND